MSEDFTLNDAVRLNAASRILERAGDLQPSSEQIMYVRAYEGYLQKMVDLSKQEAMTEHDQDMYRHYDLRRRAMRQKMRAVGVVTEQQYQAISCYLLVHELDPDGTITPIVRDGFKAKGWDSE